MGADFLALGRYAEAFEKFRLSYEGWQKRVGESVDTAMALENMGTAKLRLKAPKEALGWLRSRRSPRCASEQLARSIRCMGRSSRRPATCTSISISRMWRWAITGARWP